MLSSFIEIPETLDQVWIKWVRIAYDLNWMNYTLFVNGLSSKYLLAKTKAVVNNLTSDPFGGCMDG